MTKWFSMNVLVRQYVNENFTGHLLDDGSMKTPLSVFRIRLILTIASIYIADSTGHFEPVKENPAKFDLTSLVQYEEGIKLFSCNWLWEIGESQWYFCLVVGDLAVNILISDTLAFYFCYHRLVALRIQFTSWSGRKLILLTIPEICTRLEMFTYPSSLVITR